MDKSGNFMSTTKSTCGTCQNIPHVESWKSKNNRISREKMKLFRQLLDVEISEKLMSGANSECDMSCEK